MIKKISKLNKSIPITNEKGKLEEIKANKNVFFILPDSKGMFIIDVDYKDGLKDEYNNKPFDNIRYLYVN